MKILKSHVIIIVILAGVLVSILSFESIYNYFIWYIPLDSLKIIHGAYSNKPNSFQDVKNMEGSACFITPSHNQFCFTKPHMFADGRGGVSYVVGSNGVDGELHFDSVNKGHFYFTIKNMTRINNDETLITFVDTYNELDSKESISNKTNVEYSATIKQFDTFVANCINGNGTDVTVVQYVGIRAIGGVDYFVTWHTPAQADKAIECKYPDTIRYSLQHHFGDL